MVRRVLAAALLASAMVSCTPARPSAPGTGTARDGHQARALTAVLMRWRIRAREAGGVQGFADTTSIAPGVPVTLYISTPRPERVVVREFRMGWYGGREALLVRTVTGVRAHRQPAASVSSSTNTVVAPWTPTVRLDTTGLPPGMYLLRLDAQDNSKSFIPLTVRAHSPAGTVVLVSPVTTWQAYNRWGCCDLYSGANGLFGSRSRAVSFDRPYAAENGAGEFISRELPVVAEAERLGLRLDYLTDVDLDLDPHALDGASAVISMGHDEYWSPSMRTAVTAARDRGTNVAFLGANAIYRRIRFQPSPFGPDRLEVDYKVASEDPLDGRDPAAVTSDWTQPPDPLPENMLTGESYGCFARTRAPAVVIDPSGPLFAGTGLAAGAQVPGVIGPETDRVFPAAPGPRPLRILMHSPFPCPQGFASYADTTYYNAASGAGVFDAGTQSWVCAMSGACAAHGAATVLRRITDNLLLLFARGPAARTFPARDNTAAVYRTG